MATQTTARTHYIQIPNAVTFAYRPLGPAHGIPLLLHIHFRANMDFWDPLLFDTLVGDACLSFIRGRGHGFLWQYAVGVAEDGGRFLDEGLVGVLQAKL
ncbi:hypothetical protein B0A55_01853 [Friedmanniomyces simplex]|uniref:Uncharacterized protein n=1 Tax=Friedmanniomyces simplex TaxID=329884 RepID=A0A4U0XSL7_9PEZI|nr:hypothetical protein B0A55_01853 [Friedmanniomyces simplex]